MFSSLLFLAEVGSVASANDKSPTGYVLTYGFGASLIVGVIAGMFFCLWMLADVWFSQRPVRDKWLWTGAILVLNVVGAAIYFFSKREPRSNHLPA
jgi:hypothetical protein